MAINYESSKNEVIKEIIQEKEGIIQSLIRDYEEMRMDITRLIIEKELDEAKDSHDSGANASKKQFKNRAS